MRSTPDTWTSEERRQRSRANVHWAVYVFEDGDSRPIESKTKNLSSTGFYCFIPKALTPGDRLDCRIMVPRESLDRNQEILYLECRVKVMRVEPLEPGVMYGLACAIEDYSVVRLERGQGRAVAG
ncbi:MAG TPA: PilZ domain-containing protein [Terriglobales bacterium]